MKKDRRFPGKLNTARMALSFLIAVALLLASPLRAASATGSDGDLSFGVGSSNATLALEFFGNYTKDGSDRDSDIPYSYRGSNLYSFSLSRQNATKYRYATGFVSKKVTYALAGNLPTGLNFPSAPRPYIEDTSLPEGMTLYISGYTGNATSFTVTYTIVLDNVDIMRTKRGGWTVGFIGTGYGKASSFGASYHRISYNPAVASDWTGTVLFGEQVTDLDPGASYFYSLFHTMDNRLSSIYTRLGDLSSNVTAQAKNITDKIQVQINNDNANRDKIISALNANSKAEIASADANSRAEIADADKNASYIISALNINHNEQMENDDRNADSIMHDYDTTDQDSGNKKFDDSQKELEKVEDSLFGDALSGFSSLDMSQYSFGRFTSMLGALTFVSGFLQSAFVKMGDFGAIVTVGLVVMIATKVIGIYRFSTGGDG